MAFASSPTSAPARQESARDRTRHCVLVVAAAGYGKSTRLESWAVQAGGRCLTAPAAGSLDTASVDDASRDASHLARLAIDDLDEVARVDLLRRPILDRTATDDLVRAGLPLPDPRAHPGVQAFRAIPLVARAVRHARHRERVARTTGRRVGAPLPCGTRRTGSPCRPRSCVTGWVRRTTRSGWSRSVPRSCWPAAGPGRWPECWTPSPPDVATGRG